MGQAKRRGTYENRVIEGKIKKAQQEIELKEKQLAKIKEKQDYLNSLTPEERERNLAAEFEAKSLLAWAYGMSGLH